MLVKAFAWCYEVLPGKHVKTGITLGKMNGLAENVDCVGQRFESTQVCQTQIMVAMVKRSNTHDCDSCIRGFKSH